MKYVLLVLLLSLCGCGTAVKVQDDGAVDLQAKDSGRDMVPLLMQYKFTVHNGGHEFFFWDENRNRFNVKIKKGEDTEHGVILYLPAGSRYALSSFLVVTAIGRTEFTFGEYLELFRTKPGVVNVLPYFEVTPMDDGRLTVRQEPAHLEEARKKFPNLGEVNEVRVNLTEHHKAQTK
jgi:hypothetical protein